MPNYNNPQMQRSQSQQKPAVSEHHHMGMAEMKKELCYLMDDISTYLYEGTHFHQKAALCSLKLSIRGFGRLHSHMSKVDYCALQNLEKLSVDKLEHIPHIDMEKVSKAEMWEMLDMNAFKSHLHEWQRREGHYMECINEAIRYARKIDMQLYKELCCLADRVQNEIFRVRLLEDRLVLGGWMGQDIAWVSQTIHEFYENGEPGKHDVMDWNLG